MNTNLGSGNFNLSKDNPMFARTSIRSIAGTSVLTICSALSLSPVWAADFPTGSYAAKNLHLVFDAKGNFHVNQGKATVVSGTYSIKGDQVELTDVSGPWACTSPGQQTGAYNWKFDGTALTLSKMADSCDDRSGALAPPTWKREK